MSLNLLKIKETKIETVRLLLVIATVCCLVGCGEGKEELEAKSKKGKSGAPVAKAVLVEIGEVNQGMIEEILERSSPLEAEAQVQVLARTQNPAIELLVEEGDKVAKGDVLLRLENDRQQTDYDRSLSQLEEAKIEFDRQESLYKQQLVSESEYRNARFAFNRAQLASDTARRQLDYTEVRAPIKGTVTSRSVKVGDQVNTGTPIFELIDLDSTVAIIHVPEQYLPKLKPNMEARLISSTYEGQVFSGYVKRISPVVEARAGTIKVVVGVKDLGPLRPGMWVDVELVLSSKQDALLIPKRAIAYDNDQTFAFKVFSDTNGVMRASRHLVVPRNVDKLNVEPIDGFEAGEKIILAGQSGLKENSLIRELDVPDEIEGEGAKSLSMTNAVSILSENNESSQSVN